jgi:alpha-L-fucosidase
MKITSRFNRTEVGITKSYMMLIFVFFIVGCTESKVDPPQAILPVPSEQQMAWHEMELNVFVHYTTNTFTDMEWGFGDEKPEVFNPTEQDVDQWLRVFKEAGFKGLVLTTKHHDGFCLWPSKFTDHTIKNSPYKNGEGDVVREVAEACEKHGLKFGVYVSPWDRNHPHYGKSEYIDYYRNQLQELFTEYGPIFEMWFDGANGGDGYYGGARETRNIDRSSYYEWPKTLEMVSTIQPEVLFFSDAGPHLRWAGNEEGIGGKTNWNMITPDTLYAGKHGIERLLNTGSENGTAWIPAEVNTSIRPGWFFHESENDKVKTPEQLFEIYLSSVGRGSTLLLNIPPDKRGKIHENDIAALQGWRALINSEFKTNLAKNGKCTANTHRGRSKTFAPINMIDGNPNSYWATDDNVLSATLEVDLMEQKEVKYILLQEYIKLGQRVKAFNVEAWINDQWQEVATATSIGYKRIIKIDPIVTDKIRINLLDSKACPVISNLELY